MTTTTATHSRTLAPPPAAYNPLTDAADPEPISAGAAVGAALVGTLRIRVAGAVAGATPMRCHLLCPLIGRVHGTGPAHRIVIVRVRAS